MSKACFHCGEPVPNGINLLTNIESINQPMCCIGCQAVAQTIVDNGLTDYYRFRSAPAQKGEVLIPEQLQRNEILDDESLQNEFAYYHDGFKETILTIDGISCSACAWLIEMQVSKLDGINKITVNATTQRATVQWQESQVKLSEILSLIDKIGYHGLPFKASSAEKINKKQAKSFIKRLGISGILMMQVMMIAFGLYFGAFSDMAEHNVIYLRWASFFLTLPIVTYGAYPFYKSAFFSLKARQLSMDVPVSIAIILAFLASCWATFTQQGEVYFESVSMFTFLILIGKFLEFRARSRAADVSANLLKLMPMTATKIEQGVERFISANHLKADDIILIKPGETIPADSEIITGTSQINEAMLSGEQLPLKKTTLDNIFAGTINGDSNLTAKVKHNNQESFLSQLIRLSENAQSHKPKLAKLSDKIAQYFVALILIVTIMTAIYWMQHAPAEAFWITLSVLVVTCPCALSLATPTALTCATTRLNREGIMIKSAHVLETMPEIDAMAFDKTGTLTTGEFSLVKVKTYGDFSAENTLEGQQQVLAIAAALEAHSAHPLAKAFSPYRDFNQTTTQVVVAPGAGISGEVNNQHYRIGKSSWLLDDNQNTAYSAQCVLMQGETLVAEFYLHDGLRNDAKPLIEFLHQQDIETTMLSGDNLQGCNKLQSILQLKSVQANLSAQDKVNAIKQQQATHTVAMIGDGVNDSPVLGAAHLSIAMGSGTDIAKNGADVILLNNKLKGVQTLRQVSVRTARIIKQNYLWAFGYNAIVLPLAVTGHIAPYMAVIGMSASSILVVSNSLRLLKK
ncbi:heavy metal translocating P-type ATPase [Cognaticolwellia beringensis]|uniref:Copper-transporting ATPase n=1 Tax=Cognaticolwellia beringensis TaxID=1967665 RepID=A0A222G5W5_9GAMM|nr:heavy metal translocating P-type ATPase [Cognaticolwellia beringensis]ASP47180.1 copper-transporting ATPase [Cognaticolwellia beringensis]